MIDKEKVFKTVCKAIESINETLPVDRRIACESEAPLFSSGNIDSLGLTLLIVGIEEKVEQDFGQVITLANETMAFADSPAFQTVGALAEYVASHLEEKLNV